jgi:hypothetical protein
VLTIHTLEVRFDVESDDDAAFSRLFAEHITRWSRLQDEAQARGRASDAERTIGDPGGGEPA